MTFKTLAVPVFDPCNMQPEKPIIIFTNVKEAENYIKVENYKRAVNMKKKLFFIQCTLELPKKLDTFVSKNNQLKMF